MNAHTGIRVSRVVAVIATLCFVSSLPAAAISTGTAATGTATVILADSGSACCSWT